MDEGKPARTEKPYIRLYDDHAQYTDEGLLLINELEMIINSFLKKCFNKRAHPIDITAIFHSAIDLNIIHYTLSEVFKKWTDKKEQPEASMYDLVGEFLSKMSIMIAEKENDDLIKGWDNPKSKNVISKKLDEAVTQKNWVDVGCLAMLLKNLEEKNADEH